MGSREKSGDATKGNGNYGTSSAPRTKLSRWWCGQRCNFMPFGNSLCLMPSPSRRSAPASPCRPAPAPSVLTDRARGYTQTDMHVTRIELHSHAQTMVQARYEYLVHTHTHAHTHGHTHTHSDTVRQSRTRKGFGWPLQTYAERLRTRTRTRGRTSTDPACTLTMARLNTLAPDAGSVQLLVDDPERLHLVDDDLPTPPHSFVGDNSHSHRQPIPSHPRRLPCIHSPPALLQLI
jgi:hypothetical protein